MTAIDNPLPCSHPHPWRWPKAAIDLSFNGLSEAPEKWCSRCGAIFHRGIWIHHATDPTNPPDDEVRS